MRTLFLVLLLFPFLLFASEIKIITDIYPVYILIQDLIKNTPAKVEVITESAEDFHDHGFGLKTKDIQLIKSSGLLVSYGVKKYKDICCKSKYIDLSHHLEIIRDIISNREDLHFWLNPNNGIKIVSLIADKLAEIDKENRELYLNNAEKISDAIEKETNFIKAMFAQDKLVSADYLVLHDAYQYFEKFFKINRPYGYFYDSNHNIVNFNKIEDFKKKARNKQIKCLIVNTKQGNIIEKNFKNLVKIVYIDPLGLQIKSGIDNGYVKLLHSIYLGYRECLTI